MTEKTNLFPNLVWFRETNRLKVTVAASIMLWCTTPQQTAASIYEEHGAKTVQQTNTKVKGAIVDETGEPMVGVSVKVLTNNTGTVTDLSGEFSIDAPKGSTIEILFIGYKIVTVEVDSSPINVMIKEDLRQLDEVVVAGYGSQKKVNVTGSASMMDSKMIESRPIQNVSQALQGVIPGLNMLVGSSGGTLDSSLSISIHGGGTIGGGLSGSPLALIDGIEGDMSTMNPDDIENIPVLKDTTSSPIYGARALFGVIMIITKGGKAGKTRVNYSGNIRFLDATQIPRMVDSYTFTQYFNRASASGGDNLVFNDDAMTRTKNYIDGRYTDPIQPEYYGTVAGADGKWQSYGGASVSANRFSGFYHDWVPSTEHNLSISGGTERLTYMTSGGFPDQTGLLEHGGDKFSRYTLNAKILAKLTDWVTLNYTSKWIREDYHRPIYLTDLSSRNIARHWPTYPVIDPNGHYQRDMEVVQLEDGGKQTSQKNWYTQRLQAVFEPVKDWHIVAEGGMRTYIRKQYWAVLPIYVYDINNEPYLLSWNGGVAGYPKIRDSREDEDYFPTNIYSDFTKTLDDHYFKIMGGFNTEPYRSGGLTGFGMDLISPEVSSLGLTQGNKKASAQQREKATASFFGRVNYSYRECHMLEANLRYDGSFRFIGDERWRLFPSFSARQNVMHETFFEPLTKVVGTLKPRGSRGQLGNNNTSDTDAQYSRFLYTSPSP